MAVFRIERTRDYTVMSNHHLRNHELSLKAKGLLSMMLSLPDDWNYHRSSDPRYRPRRWSRHLGRHQPAGRLRQRQPRRECSCAIK